MGKAAVLSFVVPIMFVGSLFFYLITISSQMQSVRSALIMEALNWRRSYQKGGRGLVVDTRTGELSNAVEDYECERRAEALENASSYKVWLVATLSILKDIALMNLVVVGGISLLF